MRPEADGFYHPASEPELVELVREAAATGRQLRVRGAAHSVSHAIYTDPLAALENHVEQQAPPAGDNLNLMLDRYRGWRVRDEGRKLVEADAGIHLGADPSDPLGTSTLETSLLWQLYDQKGWTLSDTGGITHQTVSGFTATGSSGGSVTYSANDNIWGMRVVDGRGQVYEVTRDDPDPDPFYSMSPNLGLLGVVSTITFQCVDTFNIEGQEAITTVDGCAIDLFGHGDGKRPSLERFLRDTDYARIVWWPQRGAERVQVWQAQQVAPQPGFVPKPYEEFTAHPDAAEAAISVLYTVMGNLADLSRAKKALEPSFHRFDQILELVAHQERWGKLGEALAKFLAHAVEFGLDAALTVLQPLAPLIEREVPRIFPEILSAFVTLDDEKPGMERGEPQTFQDHAWHGLPMDNQADDVLVPTEFTEAWIPLGRAQEVMQLLNRYFTEPDDDHEAYRRTGLYAWELYSAKAAPFWMNAAHTAGDDEWRDGAFRVDPYWFAANPGDPATTFYPRLWKLLRSGGVPFRLHWGKFQPVYRRGERDWIDFFKAQYPRWDDFLALRAQRDPDGVFLTGYWRDRFGLWEGEGA